MTFHEFMAINFHQFWELTGFANATWQHLVMLVVGLFFIWLAIKKNFEPMLLVPIGFGILIGNIPFNAEAGLEIGIYEEGSVLNILYNGVSAGCGGYRGAAVIDKEFTAPAGNGISDRIQPQKCTGILFGRVDERPGFSRCI